MTSEDAILLTRRWLERVVIGLDLCPFAKGVHRKRQVRFAVSAATTCPQLIDDLRVELWRLRDASASANANAGAIDTTLLIHPHVLQDFLEYNDFLDQADDLVRREGLEGVIQIASFHPRYRFAGTMADDMANCTNRSPFPLLHLLREASVSRAVDSHPDVAAISTRNAETIAKLGRKGWERLVAVDE